MKVGLFLLAGQFPGMTEAEALAGAVDNAVAAEQVGLDSVWLAEHHFITYGVCPSAVALASNILGRTSRITVGTGVCMLSNRHPVALAEETALLDQVSGGRFALGVGRGGPWVDLEVFGTGLVRFEDGFAESLDLLLDGLEQGRVAADGNCFFRFRPVTVVPRPATRPRPPVVVAATAADTAQGEAARTLATAQNRRREAERFADTADGRRTRRSRKHDAQGWAEREVKAQKTFDGVVVPETARLDLRIIEASEQLEELRQLQHDRCDWLRAHSEATAQLEPSREE